MGIHASIGRLARDYAPYTASRVFDVAIATGDKMHVGVTDCLPSSVTVVYTDIEASHRSVLTNNLRLKFIQQLVDRTPFGLGQIKEGRGVSSRYYECMQLCHREIIAYCNS